MKNLTVTVVGNPNCSKTTLFSALIGTRQRVGNRPGVTVERKTGTFQLSDAAVTLVDLPGTYSLGPSETSMDERIALEYAISGEADILVNIVDASNLERHLYLTAQLLEMRVPMIVVLNMMDTAHQNDVEINLAELKKRIGCPVLPIVASSGQGVEELKRAMVTMAEAGALPKVTPRYDAKVEAAIEGICPTARIEVRWTLAGAADV
ncbi:FeoB small GTPase domain-containing protein [Breoghania sp.]|uniref:FeoB small GTPase domain-containing protein n=1 Tax=Breoghania sp. TaxID=2065378 RepID=UPI00263536C9|nr:FeoB small GTPase domain-containing protein [Breoghania sp.]MDJ0932892.1 FeoB small GTPase domain-containing protein [Breoghania sp.]